MTMPAPIPPTQTTTPPPPVKSDFEKLLERDFITPEMTAVATEMRAFDQRMRKARVYAASDVVPAHYRGKENNCYVAIEIAERLKVSELMVMQNTYVISGKLGFQGQFAIAVINSANIFQDALEFEVEGDDPRKQDYRMRCVARRLGGKRDIKGPWVTWDMVKAEGWSSRTGSKWMTIPDMMFRYRAAAFFGRTVCPELLMGFQTVEELEDVGGEITKHHTNVNTPMQKHSLSAIADGDDKAGVVAPVGAGVHSTDDGPRQPDPSPTVGAAAPRNVPTANIPTTGGVDAGPSATPPQNAGTGVGKLAQPAPDVRELTKEEAAKQFAELPIADIRGKLKALSIGSARQKDAWMRAKEECTFSGLVSDADDESVRNLAYWASFFQS